MIHQSLQLDRAGADGPAGAGPEAERGGDPRDLLALACDSSAAARRSLALSMADLFGGSGAGVSARSRDLAAEILDRLIRAFETDLRAELAERLASKPDVPRALILLLANDAIEVARPVLLESQVLLPDDLIEIIRRQGPDHQLAIAMRRGLTEAVCEALVGTDNLAVIETLLNNADAPIPGRTMAYLVEEAHWIEAYREPLVRRQELRPPLARRLYALVSAALRSHILEHFDIDPEALDDEIERVVVARNGPAAVAAPAPEGELAESGPAQSPCGAQDAQAPGTQSSQQVGALDATPPLLIKLLRDGQRSLFEQRFAELSGLRPPRLAQVLYGRDGRDLAVACRALGMDKNSFAVIVFLCRQGGPVEAVDDPRTVAQVIDYFDQMEQAAAQSRLRRWRRDPEYVAAIEDLENRAGAHR